MILKKINVFLFLLIIGIFSNPLIIFAADKFDMGHQCILNSQCKSDDCEDSAQLDEKGNKIRFCDCDEADPGLGISPYSEEFDAANSEDCANQYGGKKEDWICRDGANVSYDVDYCYHKTDGVDSYPVLKKGGDFTISDAVFDTQALIRSSEIDQIIKAPTTKISIPGLKFTSEEELKGRIIEDVAPDGSTGRFLTIPFLGEYLTAGYKYAIVIASIIAIVMIINNGLKWIMSGGASDKISEAQKRIGEALMGLFIALASYTLLYTINPELTKFKNLKVLYIDGIEFDLETTDKGLKPYEDPGAFRTANIVGTNGTNGPQALSFTGFDSIFQAYSNCVGVDWKYLKAMAFIESRFDSSVCNKNGFCGMFQTTSRNCKSILKPVKNEQYCTMGKELPPAPLRSPNLNKIDPNYESLLLPEVSTMVGTQIINDSIKKIKNSCPKDISPDSFAYLLYIGHQSGHVILRKLLTKIKDVGCDYTKAAGPLLEAQREYDKNLLEDCSNKIDRCSVAKATEGDNGGKKMIDYIKQLGGVTNTYSDINKSACPFTNPALRVSESTLSSGVGGNQITGEIRCNATSYP
ncbi:MAG: transglycosylase SLT domain-containing protein, partial [Candidatus Magasanikiibacteriota bacterium]